MVAKKQNVKAETRETQEIREIREIREIKSFCEEILDVIRCGGSDEFNDEIATLVKNRLNSIADLKESDDHIRSIVNDDSLVDEEKRMYILLFAIENGFGLKWASSVLEKYQMRALYLRNLQEFVLHFCLDSNDRNDDKYTLKQFNQLYKKCEKSVKNAKKNSTVQTILKSKNPTIAELDDFVSCYTETNAMQTYTKNITENIAQSLRKIENSRNRSESLVLQLATNYANEYVEASLITRLYFAKFVSYIAKAQAREFKEILLDFTTLTAVEAYNKYSALGGERYWSLKRIFSDNIAFDDNKIKFTRTNNTMLEKFLLDELVASFVLYGNNPSASSKLMKTLSQFKDNINIFRKEGSDEQCGKLRPEVEKLSINDFLGLKIKCGDLYQLIFDRSWAPKNDISLAMADSFVKEIIGGERDLSRRAFLLFLSTTNQVLKASDSYKYIESEDSLGVKFPEKDILDERRFRDIVRRCHFAPVGNYKEDVFYYTNSELPTEAFEKWYINVDMLDSPAMPYEITYIKVKDMRVRETQKSKRK